MHPRPLHRPASRTRAFTLIELLVSMAVLTLIILLISQLFSSATNVTVSNRERLDADSQARVVFDHLALDIGKMLKRNDVDYFFAKLQGDGTGGNDKMYFYSEAPAYYDLTDSSSLPLKSSVALVGYRINQAFQLERLGKQLTWDGTATTAPSPGASPGGVMFLSPGVSSNPDPRSTLAGNWPNTIGTFPYTSTPVDGDYQVLADQVCRFEVCFQLRDGNFSPIPVCPLTNLPPLTNGKIATPFNVTTSGPLATSDISQSYAIGSRWYDSRLGHGYVCVNNTAGAAVWASLGVQDVRAIVVALAILDGTSVKIVPTTSQTINGQTVLVPRLQPLIDTLKDADPADAFPGGNASTADATKPTFPTPSTAGTPVPPATPTPIPSRLMAEAWNNALAVNQPSFAQTTQLPQRAASQVRIYQRSFVLNNQ